MFGAVHRSGQEYQVRVIENTVMTGTKGREGEVFYHNIMMLSMQCGIHCMEGSPHQYCHNIAHENAGCSGLVDQQLRY